MGTPDVIRSSRVKMRLTQAELAKEIGVDVRQINRYETGATEPTLAIARRLADRLRITIDELAGADPSFTGTWWSAWHGLVDDDTIFGGPVELTQTGQHLSIHPDRNHTRPPHISWSAEVYVDANSLLGGYKINTSDHRGIGLLNLSNYDHTISGAWIRTSLTAAKTGNLALASDWEQAVARIHQMPRISEI